MQPFFRTNNNVENDWFYEGPKEVMKVYDAINTSSIPTSAIDKYRQGVELTQIKHFDAGLLKIHAGESGHVIRRNSFGGNNNSLSPASYQDIDYFDPIEFLRSQETFGSQFTYPIITSDNNQSENFVFDGIIEPLTIRAVVSFFSINFPFEPHAIRGTIMGCNTDQFNASDVIANTRVCNQKDKIVSYLDMIDMVNGKFPIAGMFENRQTTIEPFTDKQNIFENAKTFEANLIRSETDIMMVLCKMSGGHRDMGYVAFDLMASSCGRTYNTIDSIAFEGMSF